MAIRFHCPECRSKLQFADSVAEGTMVRCPHCRAVFDMPGGDSVRIHAPAPRRLPSPVVPPDANRENDWEEDEEDFDRPRRRPARRKTNGLMIGLAIAGIMLVLMCGGVIALMVWVLSPTSFPEQKEDYALARSQFQTQLLRKGPAPQTWNFLRPPPEAMEVTYRSGALTLKAWVNRPPQDNRKAPAVLFLHGGFAFGKEDWDQAQPYRDAGFVVMTPLLRGENGQPGFYSMFYDEVNDVLGAADTLAQLPYVDPNRLYVAGHSAGGTLALLAAMTTPRFRAAAAFSGSPDQVAWARGQENFVPFDLNNQREFQLRSPLAYPASFKCPTRLYFGNQEVLFRASTERTAELAKGHQLDVQAVSVPGNHFTAVNEAMRQSIAFFREHWLEK